MKKYLTFKHQILVGIWLMIASIVLGLIFKNGIFHNIAWVMYGIMWIINPVCPESLAYQDTQKMKKSIYIAGAICIIVGLITRFGV